MVRTKPKYALKFVSETKQSKGKFDCHLQQVTSLVGLFVCSANE